MLAGLVLLALPLPPPPSPRNAFALDGLALNRRRPSAKLSKVLRASGSRLSEFADMVLRSSEVMATTSTPSPTSLVDKIMASGPIFWRTNFRASAAFAAVNFWGPMSIPLNQFMCNFRRFCQSGNKELWHRSNWPLAAARSGPKQSPEGKRGGQYARGSSGCESR